MVLDLIEFTSTYKKHYVSVFFLLVSVIAFENSFSLITFYNTITDLNELIVSKCQCNKSHRQSLESSTYNFITYTILLSRDDRYRSHSPSIKRVD